MTVVDGSFRGVKEHSGMDWGMFSNERQEGIV